MEVVESPFVRVPFEALKRAAKERKYIVEEVEKVMSMIQKQTKDEEDGGKEAPSPSAMDVDVDVDVKEDGQRTKEEEDESWRGEIDSMLSALGGLKRKLEESTGVETKHIDRCKARVEHLMSLGSFGSDRALSWNKKRMKRLVVDYLLRQGYHDTALHAVSADEELGHLVELEIFKSAQEIVESLRNRDCGLALEWCKQHRSKLRRIKSKLEFKLRIREFICLVQAGKVMDAVRYSQKHLSRWAYIHMPELQATMATLVYGPCFQQHCNKGEPAENAMDVDDQNQGPQKEEEQEGGREGDGVEKKKKKKKPSFLLPSPWSKTFKIYGHLFEDSQWETLVQIFKRDMYQLYMLPADSNLAIHVQAGLSALKTPMSYSNSCSKEDPLSLEAFRKLSEKLPYAKHSKSRLVCFITKQVMNEHNPPMVLPNGMVYSRSACEELAKKHDKKIVCPRTGDTCDFSELKRAYPV